MSTDQSSPNREYPTGLESFFDDGLLTDVLYEVKSGKEATVHCCRGGDRLHGDLVAAKIYRPLESRSFRNDAMYQGGRVHLARDSRIRRATERKSAFGLKVQAGTWVEHEWETMNLLFDAGVAVPEPIARNGRAILMTYLGDEDGPAPLLKDVTPDVGRTASIVDALLDDVALMLELDRVHGDLSAYNVLYAAGRAVIIDFPQTIDPRLNRNGRELLTRDIEQLCRWAGRHGVDRPAERIARRLWSSFVVGEIG